jgi:hypothetical protein
VWQGQLKESRIKKLESIGFSWELHMDWDSRMQQVFFFFSFFVFFIYQAAYGLGVTNAAGVH